MAEVTDIRTARGTRRQRVYLDGSEWRSVPAEVVRDIGLRVGQQSEPGELESRIEESEPSQAWERALRLLNFRDRGSGELERRLTDDGYGPDVVADVVLRARELGFIDDRRFAEGLARSLADGKRQGRRRVAAGLAAKGVSDELAADVLASYCDEETEHERALSLARKLDGGRGMEVPRLASRLVSRGFSSALAYGVAKQVVQERDTPSDEG